MHFVRTLAATAVALVALFAYPFSTAAAPAADSSNTTFLPPTPSLPPGGAADRLVRPDGAEIWYILYDSDGANKHEQGSDSDTSSAHPSHGQAPQTVTFLHGALSSSNAWGGQIEHLLRRTDIPAYGYRLLAIDMRGQGRSSFSPSDTQTSYDTMADDVVAVLDHLSISKTAVVGWSDGGKVALNLAINHTASQRLDGLFTLGSSYRPANVTEDVLSQPTIQTFLERAPFEYLTMNPAGEEGWNKLTQRLNEMWTSYPNWSVADLASIDVDKVGQVWIAAGAEEEVVPRHITLEMHDAINGSGLVILPRVGHFALWQDGLFFNAALDRFLDISYREQARGEQE